MDLIIFSFFSFFLLSILILAWHKKIVFLSVFSGISFIVMSAFLLQFGLSITYAGSYGLVNVANETITGIVSSTTAFQDPFIVFMSGAYAFLGLGSFIIPIVYAMQKGEVKE